MPESQKMDEQKIAELQGQMKGPVLVEGTEGYDRARTVWNGLIDRKPTVIAQCDGVADVMAAVKFARAQSLPVAVRGGGHNVAGSAVCENGLVVDLSRMRQVLVDPSARTARAQGGATWLDLDRETQAFGLAVPGGKVSTTGVAGLTLGGGAGWMRRKHGMTCDNVRAIDLVTADGEFITASEQSHPDLFWALRGGGGNFGVVTSFEFQCHPVGPDIFFTFCGYPAEKAPKVVSFFREFAKTAPEDMAMLCVCLTFPDDPAFPVEAARGQQAIAVLAMHLGTVEEGEKVLTPLRSIDEPLADLSGPNTYGGVQTLLDAGYPTGRKYYWKALHLSNEAVSDKGIEAFLEHGFKRPSPLSTLALWQMGGAVDKPSMKDNAYPGRNAPFFLAAEANWDAAAESDQNIAWTRGAVDAMEPFAADTGVYLNFPGLLEDNDALVKRAFGDSYDRLAQVKAKYDPSNVFRFNQNIKPA